MASQVHRVRYYNPKPEPVSCVSFNKTKKLLALARVDASIEVWDLQFAPYIVKFIPGVENGSIEALCWVENRLLSTGLVGSVVEWDLDKLTVKNTVLLTGYAAWCLDVNSDNTMIAVGTEQGYVNLFNVEHGDIVYAKLFDKQEGRIMCCKFDKTGNFLITGSLNSIRVWNTQTGHAITRMSLSGSNKKQDIIVWCLAVLSDNIVVSGDSDGRITFWDSALGDQIESYKTHKGDILTIAVSDDEEQIYCSGVDPMIMSYQKVAKSSGGSTLQWMKNVQRNIHVHDVRGLVMNDQKLISVGNDGYLSLSSYPPKWVKRVPPMVPGPRSSLSVQKKLLLLRYSKHLEIWRLGAPAISEQGQVLFTHNNEQQANVTNGENQLELDSSEAMNKALLLTNNNRKTLKVGKNPVKLVALHTKKKKPIRCCEISPSGEFIVYGTDSDLRMLKLDTDDDESNTSLTKMMISGVPLPCNRVVFTGDSRTMVAHTAGALQVLQVDPGAGATVIQTINTNKHLKTGSILHLLVSKATTSKRVYLVAADTEGAIAVWTHTGHKFEHYATLPTYKSVPSAVAVDADKESLVITYVDQKLMEYKLAEKRFEEWPRYGLPASWYARESAVQAVTPHPARDALVFQDETSLWVVERPSDAEVMEYKLAEKRFEEWPRYGLPASWHARESAVQAVTPHPARDALVFQDETSLWVVERPSDAEVMEYKLAEKRFEEWPRYGLPASWHARESAVQAVTPHPARDALVFQDEASLWVVERPSDAEVQDLKGPGAKRDRKEQRVREADIKVIPIKYLAGFHWLGASEALSIELLPETIVAQLPATAVKTRNFNVG